MEERLRARSNNAVWRLSLVLVFTWITFIVISITLLWSLVAVRQELLTQLSKLENAGLNRACDCLRLQEKCCMKMGNDIRIGYQESSDHKVAHLVTRQSADNAKKLILPPITKAVQHVNEPMPNANKEVNVVRAILSNTKYFRLLSRREAEFPQHLSSKISKSESVDTETDKHSVYQSRENSKTVKRQEKDVLLSGSTKDNMQKAPENSGEHAKNGSKKLLVRNPLKNSKDPVRSKDLVVPPDDTTTVKSEFHVEPVTKKRTPGRNQDREKAMTVDSEQDTSLPVTEYEDTTDELDDEVGSGCDTCGQNLRTYIKNMVKDAQISMRKEAPKSPNGWLPTCRCRNVTTDWNTTYNIGISKFLESHTIACSENEFLQSIVFRGNKDEFFPLYRYEFRCCRILKTRE